MTLREAADFLKANDDFILVSHDGADADGLGAAYALTLALQAIGKRALPILGEELSHKYHFIDQRGLFRIAASESDLPIAPAEACFVILDTHDLDYLGARMESMVSQGGRILVIDHHEIRNPIQPFQFLDSTASSSCELVFLISRLLGQALPLDACEAIFAGIVYDTGSFSYPKTSERTFDCALDLVKAGVKPYLIHKTMYESSSIGVLILEKMVLSSLELASSNRIAVQFLRKRDLLESGASYEDAEGFINTPLQSESVEVSIFFKENLDGRLRCSLRSKGTVNVAQIAQSFGGGGHKTASGFSCGFPLESMKAAVLESIIRAFPAK